MFVWVLLVGLQVPVPRLVARCRHHPMGYHSGRSGHSGHSGQREDKGNVS